MQKIDKLDQDLHEKFSSFGKNAREWMRKCVLLLPEIERRRVWEKKSFSSIYEYAAKLAGMSHETVNDALRILKKIENKPLLQKIVEQKGINCIKPIVNLVEDKESEKFWAEKAKSMSRHTLETYVQAIRGQERRTGPSENGLGNSHVNVLVNQPAKVEIKMQVSTQIADKLQKLKGDKDWEDLMDQFLKMREEKLEQEFKQEFNRKLKQTNSAKLAASVKPSSQANQSKLANQSNQSNLKLLKAKSRYIPAAIKKFVLQKTAGVCAYPSCKRPAKILHHTERYETNRQHDPTKITPLCEAHERIAHLGLIENEEGSAETWKILRQADTNQLKFIVDAEVAEYRR